MIDKKIKDILSRNSHVIFLIADDLKRKNNMLGNISSSYLTDISDSDRFKFCISSKNIVISSNIGDHIKWVFDEIKGDLNLIDQLKEDDYYISMTFFSEGDEKKWSDVIEIDVLNVLNKVGVPLFINVG